MRAALRLLGLMFVAGTLAASTTAATGAPPNDDRANATGNRIAACALSGTTIGATDDARDPRTDSGALTATLGRGLLRRRLGDGRWARPLPALAARAATDDDDHPRERLTQRDRLTGLVGRDRRGRELQPGRTNSPANGPL